MQIQVNRENIVSVAVNVLRQERELYRHFLSEQSLNCGETLLAVVNDSGCGLSAAELAALEEAIDRANVYAAVWWYSVLYHLVKSNDIYCRYAAYIWEHKDYFSPNTLCFLHGQVMREKFVNAAELDNLDNKKTELSWHNYINDLFQDLINTDLSRIPLKERNPKRIIVLINQQLAPPHAPSGISLNYCKELIDWGYDVTLVNTAEVLSQAGGVPLAAVTYPNYVHQWGRGGKLTHNDTVIPYIQLPLDMPNTDGITQVLNYIREQKPILLLCIGAGGITMSLADKIVPALTIPLGSRFPMLCTRFTSYVGRLNGEDNEFIKYQNGDEFSLIPREFQFSWHAQQEHINRQDVGLTDGRFVVSVVGNRLNEELDGEFLSLLERVASEKTAVMFVGDFDYKNKLISYPQLQLNSVYLGHCADLLSRLELCDIFVNPHRSGGATSAVMALCKSKPVLTVDFGDIASVTGEEFCVKDYAEMEQQIRRYANEPLFYAEMSQKAKQRGIFLTENQYVLRNVIDEAIKRCRELEL